MTLKGWTKLRFVIEAVEVTINELSFGFGSGQQIVFQQGAGMIRKSLNLSSNSANLKYT